MSALLLSGCGGKKDTAPHAYDDWKASLADSIAAVDRDMRLTKDSIEAYHAEVASLLDGFTHVDNPRLVEGYTICRGWESKYPLATTGLIARVTADEGFELVAALRGGTFDHISATAGGQTVESAVVPYDQALNYRQDGLNTVAFTGAAADSIGRLIASAGTAVEIAYLNTGRAGAVTLTRQAADMIGRTWRLVNAQRNSERLERQVSLLSARLDMLRRVKDNDHVTPSAVNDSE